MTGYYFEAATVGDTFPGERCANGELLYETLRERERNPYEPCNSTVLTSPAHSWDGVLHTINKNIYCGVGILPALIHERAGCPPHKID